MLPVTQITTENKPKTQDVLREGKRNGERHLLLKCAGKCRILET